MSLAHSTRGTFHGCRHECLDAGTHLAAVFHRGAERLLHEQVLAPRHYQFEEGTVGEVRGRDDDGVERGGVEIPSVGHDCHSSAEDHRYDSGGGGGSEDVYTF